MYYKLSERPLTQFASGSTTLFNATPPSATQFKWRVEIYGIKDYYIGHSDCNISDGSFAIGTFGSGNAKITMANIDVPIDSQDRVNIYYNNTRLWSGYIEEKVDPRLRNVSLAPISKQFSNVLIASTFSSAAWSTSIIPSIITGKSTYISINYNANQIAISSTNTASIDFDYDTPKNIFDDMIKLFDDYYCGVDASNNNEFYIRKYSTSINHYFYISDYNHFTGIDVKIDDSKIKYTRAQVFQKSTASGESVNVRIGQVGYSTSIYPTLQDIENRVGVIETKLTVPQGLAAAEALNYAYQQIVAQAVVNTNIKIKGLDLNYYPTISIGDMIRVYMPDELIWNTIIDCEDINSWSNVTLASTSKRGVSSISLAKGSLSYYDFGNYRKWHEASKIGFFVKSDYYGQILGFSIKDTIMNSTSRYSEGNYSQSSTTILNSTYAIFINAPGSWQWVEFALPSDSFSVLTFENNSTYNIYIDNISLYQYYHNYYEGNIQEISYTLGSDLVDITAGYYDRSANDKLFELEKRVKELEITNQG